MKWLFDAGHGGNDPGAVSGGRKESNDNLRLTLDIAKILRANGETVELTRSTDVTIPLSSRSAVENQSKYDYFVSIHRNAHKGKSYGAETFSLKAYGKGRELSEKVQKELGKIFENRGCKTENFHVLRETKSPAILIEVGFIDNDKDNKIFDDKYNDIAHAIAKGCLSQVGKTIKPIVSEGYRVCIGFFESKNNADKLAAEAKTKGFDAYVIKK